MKVTYGILILCLAGVVTGAMAVPPLPYEFYGTCTIDSEPVPAGTEIVAKLDGTILGTITTAEAGRYGDTGTFDKRLVVNTGEDTIGKTLDFWIGDRQAAQTVTLQAGESQELNLRFEEGLEGTIDASLTPQPDMGTPELPIGPLPTKTPLGGVILLSLLGAALLVGLARRS